MSVELETCYECFALTGNLRDHAEWHKKINVLIEKATGIHPVCHLGHHWQSDFAGGLRCGRCNQVKGENK